MFLVERSQVQRACGHVGGAEDECGWSVMNRGGGEESRVREGGGGGEVDTGKESGFYSKGDGKPPGFLWRSHSA